MLHVNPLLTPQPLGNFAPPLTAQVFAPHAGQPPALLSLADAALAGRVFGARAFVSPLVPTTFGGAQPVGYTGTFVEALNGDTLHVVNGLIVTRDVGTPGLATQLVDTSVLFNTGTCSNDETKKTLTGVFTVT